MPLPDCWACPAWISTPQSSNVQAFAFIDDLQILAVKFRNDTTYIYVGVSHELALRFANAGSKGGFVHAQLEGKFPYYRLDKMDALVEGYRARYVKPKPVVPTLKKEDPDEPKTEDDHPGHVSDDPAGEAGQARPRPPVGDHG